LQQGEDRTDPLTHIDQQNLLKGTKDSMVPYILATALQSMCGTGLKKTSSIAEQFDQTLSPCRLTRLLDNTRKIQALVASGSDPTVTGDWPVMVKVCVATCLYQHQRMKFLGDGGPLLSDDDAWTSHVRTVLL
jgi:hypothetical protein